jgi:hypothetical protein
MKIPPFWARATDGTVAAFGWSFSSADEAQLNAQERLGTIAARLRSGDLPPHGDQYYCVYPVREPIMREFRDSEGNVSALITRNSYGALVLNAARALFVDVDFPDPEPQTVPPGTGFFARLFGGSKPEPTRSNDLEQQVLQRAEDWSRQYPGWCWRVYRTKAGVRLLATHALFSPGDPIVERVFDAMETDPLYRRLCKVQECFRARLTPKPWRCDYYADDIGWPFPNEATERAYSYWESGYLDRCQKWATCELITSTGSQPVHPALTEIVTFHDQATRITSGLPLA